VGVSGGEEKGGGKEACVCVCVCMCMCGDPAGEHGRGLAGIVARRSAFSGREC